MLPGLLPKEETMQSITIHGTVSANRSMTVREVAAALGVSEDSVLRVVKSRFPELVQNGKTTFLGEVHVTAVKLELEGHHNLRSTAELQNIHTALEKQLLIRQAMALQDEMIAELQGKVAAQGQALAIAAPKAESFDRFLDASGTVCISDAAKALGVSPSTLFHQLDDRGLIFKRAGDWLPHQEYLERGWFEVRVRTYGEPPNEHITRQARVTPKGLDALARIFPKEVSA
jgi:phage antirepressor YoqD-like protein